jgi:hypothetical protein
MTATRDLRSAICFQLFRFKYANTPTTASSATAVPVSHVHIALRGSTCAAWRAIFASLRTRSVS